MSCPNSPDADLLNVRELTVSFCAKALSNVTSIAPVAAGRPKRLDTTSAMATVARGATVTFDVPALPRMSWKVRVAVTGLALRLWSVSSVCQWLSFAPGPVPEAGMTSVVALAASVRSGAKSAARMRVSFISGFSFVVLPGNTRIRKRVSRNLCDHSI